MIVNLKLPSLPRRYVITLICIVHSCLLTFTNMPAEIRVRSGSNLCAEEREYLRNRAPVTHTACEALLQKKIRKNHAPRVALCFSGGGMRSTIMSLGCLKAAQEIGLLDCCSYVAALSGSTWSIASVTALAGTYTNPQQTTSAQKISERALRDYISFLRTNLNIHDPESFISSECAEELWAHLKTSIFNGHSLSATEFYGHFLTALLMPKLSENRFTTTLSKTHAFVKNGQVAMPIYTAVEASESPYRWTEFTPFETGIAEDINAYIPANSFGCQFANGLKISTDTGDNDTHKCEKTLGYCLATFGSALAVNPQDLILHLSDTMLSKISTPYLIKFAMRLLLDRAINKLFENNSYASLSAMRKIRLMAGVVPNYCAGMHNCPLHEHENLSFVDSGIAFGNLPIVPLLKPARHVDVIIIFDASQDTYQAPALATAEHYARAHDMPFPAIDYTDIEKHPISIFPGTDAQTPTIIYLPRFARETENGTDDSYSHESCLDDGSCSTLRFSYTPEKFDALLNASYTTFKKYAPLYKKVIRDKIALTA